MDVDELKTSVSREVEANKDRLNELSLKIHANPELGFHEVKAADWLTGFKADPSTAPLALRSVFEQATPEATPRPKPVPSRANPPGGSAEITSEKVLAVRQRAQSTGDWAEYMELRKQMGFVR